MTCDICAAAVDLAHRRGHQRAPHEVSRARSQPAEGQCACVPPIHHCSRAMAVKHVCLSLTEQRPVEQACAVRPVNHRAALFPRAGQTRARAAAGGVQSRAGRRERAAGGFLPHHTAVLIDESLVFL